MVKKICINVFFSFLLTTQSLLFSSDFEYTNTTTTPTSQDILIDESIAQLAAQLENISIDNKAQRADILEQLKTHEKAHTPLSKITTLTIKTIIEKAFHDELTDYENDTDEEKCKTKNFVKQAYIIITNKPFHEVYEKQAQRFNAACKFRYIISPKIESEEEKTIKKTVFNNFVHKTELDNKKSDEIMHNEEIYNKEVSKNTDKKELKTIIIFQAASDKPYKPLSEKHNDFSIQQLSQLTEQCKKETEDEWNNLSEIMQLEEVCSQENKERSINVSKLMDLIASYKQS